MTQAPFRLGIYLVVSVLLMVGVLPVVAQTNTPWTVDTFTDGFGPVGGPALVADRYGGTHLFWTQGEMDNAALNYAYRPLGGEWTWTDVIAGAVSVPAVAIDDQDFLHLVWDSGGTLLYTKVHLEQTMDARSWPEPSVMVEAQSLGTSFTYDLKVGPQGILHVPYTIRNDVESSVHYLRSMDSGENWEGTDLYTPDDLAVAVDGPQLAIGADETLHLVWHLRPRPLHYGGAGVYYVRSSDMGVTWTTPYRIDKQSAEDPTLGAWSASIAVLGDQEVHVVWDANTLSGRRFHQWSSDGGRTWSSPEPVMGVLIAQTGFNPMVIDSTGTLYLFASGTMVWDEPLGVYISAWSGSAWSTPSVVDQTLDDNPHYLQAVISGGNTLCVAWKGGADTARCASLQIDAPLKVDLLPNTPTLTPSALTTPEPTALPAPVENITQPAKLTSEADLRTRNDAISILPLSIVPPLLLVVLAIWIFSTRRKG